MIWKSESVIGGHGHSIMLHGDYSFQMTIKGIIGFSEVRVKTDDPTLL